MRKMLLILLLCLSGTAFSAIYKWVDEQGGVHYTDKLQPGVEAVEISEPTVYRSGPDGAKPAAPETAPSPAPGQPADARGEYTGFRIAVPAYNATIKSNEGIVQLEFEILPRLQESHTIQVILDGRILDRRFTNSRVPLRGVERGGHQVQASIHDASGAMQMRSNLVQFFMRQDSVIEEGKPPQPPPSGQSGRRGVDAPQYDPASIKAEDYYNVDGSRVPQVDDPEYRPDNGPGDYGAEPGSVTPGRTNPDFVSPPSSHTPGRTNPNYVPGSTYTPGTTNPAYVPPPTN
jgi:hypothetical protein